MGGFGVTPADDLLYVQEFVTVQQQVSCISVDLDDDAVADFFENQVDLGRRPEQFARLWVHTHPGDSPQPSGVDETTFERVFGECDWAVMFIIAQNSGTYARMSLNIGPGGQVLIPTEVDFSKPFQGCSHGQWDQEYDTNVCSELSVGPFNDVPETGSFWDVFGQDPFDVLDGIENLHPIERQGLLDDLADRPELWGLGSEVMSI